MNVMIELIIFVIIIVPFSLFWHELGHLIGAKIVRASHVTLTIGLGKTIYTLTFKQMTFVIKRFFLFHSLTETSRIERLSRKEIIIVTILGPINNLVLTVIASSSFLFIKANMLVYLIIFFNGWLGLINLIPFKINNKPSDGYTIMQMIKNDLKR